MKKGFVNKEPLSQGGFKLRLPVKLVHDKQKSRKRAIKQKSLTKTQPSVLQELAKGCSAGKKEQGHGHPSLCQGPRDGPGQAHAVGKSLDLDNNANKKDSKHCMGLVEQSRGGPALRGKRAGVSSAQKIYFLVKDVLMPIAQQIEFIPAQVSFTCPVCPSTV